MYASFMGAFSIRSVCFIALLAGLALVVATSQSSADQIEMQNGDRYIGQVLAFTNDTVVLQSELLGAVRLPKSKVASINLGPGAATNFARLPAPRSPLNASAVPGTKAGTNSSETLQTSAADAKTIQQIQKQFLSDAGPEANKKFTELAGGFLSGKLDLADIRAEAASAVNQLRALKKDQGEDTTGSLDGYLSILDKFLSETAPPSGAKTNTVHAFPKSADSSAKLEPPE